VPAAVSLQIREFLYDVGLWRRAMARGRPERRDQRRAGGLLMPEYSNSGRADHRSEEAPDIAPGVVADVVPGVVP
jgi:hypothetical protein